MMYEKAESYTNVSHALPRILQGILTQGDEVGSRLGERTKELLHCHIALERPWQREILVPGRKASIAAQIAETMWVLTGRNDVEWLSHYLPRAKDFSDDGETWRGGYGPRIRQWEAIQETFHEHAGRVFGPRSIDQLDEVIKLLRKEPSTRRAVVQIYDPAVDSQPGKDIPCNDWLHFISRLGKLDLHVAVRSNDVMWGWSGINAFEWSALLEIVAGMTGLMVGELHFSTTSFHLYDRHWAKAKELAKVEPIAVLKDSPRFKIPHQAFHTRDLDILFAEWFEAEEAIRTGRPYDINSFPEPMLRSWLCVLAWWWQGSERALDAVLGTPLYWAALHSPKSPFQKDLEAGKLIDEVTGAKPQQTDPFVAYVANLHAEKNEAYGTSWKRRGEAVAILANIARKVDRLGFNGAGDTATDTAVDLLVYLVKYRIWLSEKMLCPLPFGIEHWMVSDSVPISEQPALVTQGFAFLADPGLTVNAQKDTLEASLTEFFEMLESSYSVNDTNRWSIVDSMVLTANTLARGMWAADMLQQNYPLKQWADEAGPSYVNQDRS